MLVTLTGFGFAYGQLKKQLDTAMLMDDLGQMLRGQVDRRFESETSPDGKPWPKSWRAKFEGGQTLSDSGKFRKSFSHEYNKRQTEVGTNWPWAKSHHHGVKIKPKNKKTLRFLGANGPVFTKQATIPARPVLGFSKEDLNLIEQTVKSHLNRRFS